ncbi:hypothetical protein TRAPUB_12066 [Trametes pubescens]|uniref:Uncharacterized protein n=1 Tax=Trametes pubescens TaxID=154538 RepID=A0A1M2VV60_TRAPU|nr:hypothetical protein TRAPUB_12066 [Trametes pubescens]
MTQLEMEMDIDDHAMTDVDKVKTRVQSREDARRTWAAKSSQESEESERTRYRRTSV